MTDVDLLRRLMLMLEERELSPRQNVVIDLYPESAELNCSAEHMADGLDRLLAIDYIEGPGMDDEGFFLFLKVTRRGTQFLNEVRHPRDWDRIKKLYASGDPAP